VITLAPINRVRGTQEHLGSSSTRMR